MELTISSRRIWKIWWLIRLFIGSNLDSKRCTVSKFFIEFLHEIVFLIGIKLIYFLSVIDHFRTSLLYYLVIHIVMLFHLQDYWEIFFHDFSLFSKIRNTISDFVDNIAKGCHSWVKKRLPKTWTMMTTPISTGFFGEISPYPIVKMVVELK